MYFENLTDAEKQISNQFVQNHTMDDDDVLSSESDDDAVFDEDLEALRSACMLTGTDPASATATAAAAAAAPSDSDGDSEDDDDDEDDLELLRNIQKRFSVNSDIGQQPLSLPPLCSLPPAASGTDDDDDDFETLRAIQRRFAAYSSLRETSTLDKSTEDVLRKPEQGHALAIASEDTSNDLSKSLDNVERKSSGFIEWHQSDVPNLSLLPLQSSSFPKSAQMFYDAIKKNRSCQKFIRSKLIQIEARIEENRKLKERVKILKDFQAACRRRTGLALSQKKDPRVQLISSQKPWTSNNSKIDDKKVSAMSCGPEENSHVSNYRMALTKYPLSLERKKWSDTEKENLGKGMRQQFQEMMLQISVDQFSHSEESAGESNSFDDILASIKNYEITSEQIREFLPKVNWDQLASMYVAGRSSAECEARWLNCEDPLLNHGPWTPQEDKNLLLIVQEMGISNWLNIAASMRTNRTPFQCLARYQRSLNACILKKEWTKEEDDKLRIAVETYGESNWQTVASTLEGRTGPQCSNRWKKSLHPSRQKVGRWSRDEDKRLKVAVMLFGAKNWKKIAQFVPGRTQVQCRERWVNSLDPSLNLGKWTEEEDSRLRAAIVEHGYCWYKVAACVPPRTDNQCRRRWKVLLPEEVPLLQAAKKIQKTALIGNFVDRELERPTLGPKDFLPLAASSLAEPESGSVNSRRKCKRKSRGQAESYNVEAASCSSSRPKRSKMARKAAQNCLDKAPWMTDHSDIETPDERDAIFEKETGTDVEKVKSVGPCTKGKRKSNSHSRKLKSSEQDTSGQSLVLPPDASTTSKKRKRALKKPRMSNKSCAELGDVQNQRECSLALVSLGTNDGGDTMIDNQLSCPQSIPLMITNGEEVETIGRDGEKRALKVYTRRKMRKEAPKNG